MKTCFFSEVDSHRNSPGSNEKKTRSSPTLLLKNIAGTVFIAVFRSCRKCLHKGQGLGSIHNHHTVLSWTFSQKSWLTEVRKATFLWPESAKNTNEDIKVEVLVRVVLYFFFPPLVLTLKLILWNILNTTNIWSAKPINNWANLFKEKRMARN